MGEEKRDLYGEKLSESIAQLTDEQRNAIHVIAEMIIDKNQHMLEESDEDELKGKKSDIEGALIRIFASSVVCVAGLHIRRETKAPGPMGFESCNGRLIAPPRKDIENNDCKDSSRLVPQIMGILIGELIDSGGSADMNAREIQRELLNLTIAKAVNGFISDDDEACDCDVCRTGFGNHEPPEA